MSCPGLAASPLFNASIAIDGEQVDDIAILVVDSLVREQDTTSVGTDLGVSHKDDSQQILGSDGSLRHLPRLPLWEKSVIRLDQFGDVFRTLFSGEIRSVFAIGIFLQSGLGSGLEQSIRH